MYWTSQLVEVREVVLTTNLGDVVIAQAPIQVKF